MCRSYHVECLLCGQHGVFLHKCFIPSHSCCVSTQKKYSSLATGPAGRGLTRGVYDTHSPAFQGGRQSCDESLSLVSHYQSLSKVCTARPHTLLEVSAVHCPACSYLEVCIHTLVCADLDRNMCSYSKSPWSSVRERVRLVKLCL